MADQTVLDLQRLLELLLSEVERLKLYIARIEQTARDLRENA